LPSVNLLIQGVPMKIDRRDFLDFCFGSAINLRLEPSVIAALKRNVTGGSAPPIIWLSSGCTGCTEDLANRVCRASNAPNGADLLVDTIDFRFHKKHTETGSDSAVNTLQNAFAGRFFLVVEGGFTQTFGSKICIPWAGGQAITASQAVKTFAPKAEAVLSIGTCASFGVPGCTPSFSGFRSVRSIARVNTINIPGCPAHPSWIVWTLAQLLAGRVPLKDSLGRPSAIFTDTGRGRRLENCA